MPELVSTNINAGDPVTSDAINNLILDLYTIKASVAPSFKLSLSSAGAATPNDAAVSQKIYSQPVVVNLKTKEIGTGKWDFKAAGIKFSTPPRCWIQLVNSNTSLKAGQFDFTTVITSVTTSTMNFQVRGPFSTVNGHTFMCFAADA